MTLLKYLSVLLTIMLSFVGQAETRHFPAGTYEVSIPDTPGIRANLLQNIAPLVRQSIKNGLYPGAVVLAAHHGKIIYKGVFGNRRVIPDVAPMKFDTIFDIASLTKPVVTSTAIMQLVEQGKLDLDMPVGAYWPTFNNSGKEGVTVRELLTHTSGFPAGITFPKSEEANPKYTAKDAFKSIEQQHLIHPPGTTFKYSDVNFVALGHLVELISGEHLDHYAERHIFKPLKMQHTFYQPSLELKDHVAPTQVIKGRLRWGEVHDDTVYLMGGVSGMAGVFSTASDLGLFAQCMLNGGRIPQVEHESLKYLLGPLTILKMTTPQTPVDMADIHGLGWDIDSRYSNRGVLFPINSYGHTGWTGTSIWMDPTTSTWVIILTSRTHPTPTPVNQLIHDRKAIANIIAGSITDISVEDMSNTGEGELARTFDHKQP